MKRRRLLQILFACFIVYFITLGCGRNNMQDTAFDIADELMETKPDSSLTILNAIVESNIRGDKRKARYALLKSMALDKNYIDTSTFEILQPAIDYYLHKGNADERLRTLYYQGRIHMNAGDDDSAMQSYLKALDIRAEISDSLTYARLLVAQATIFFRQYRIKDCIENNLLAAKIYEFLGKEVQELNCYLKVLDAGTVIKEKKTADRIMAVCGEIIQKSPSLWEYSVGPFLRYYLEFGNTEEIVEALEDVKKLGFPEDMRMNLARAYSRIGHPQLGIEYLKDVRIESEAILDSLTYWSVKTEILESMGETGKALDAFKNYSRVLEIYHDQLFSNELLFSEKKHEMEIENMAQVHKRDNIIKWILATTGLLLLLAVLVYYRYRMNKAARKLAEGNAERLRVETEKLLLERDRLQLETENLRLEAGQLEDERDRLEGLLSRHETLSEEARQVIRERVSMLNGLFAQALTEEESYGKEFRKYVGKIKKDKKRFQKSIGKAMEATHPELMEYLREHGLTEREIDYVCLYAIGLRGKEIGSYLELARHYNISSDIRRKLGLDSNGKNLGPFIREMMGEGG